MFKRLGQDNAGSSALQVGKSRWGHLNINIVLLGYSIRGAQNDFSFQQRRPYSVKLC